MARPLWIIAGLILWGSVTLAVAAKTMQVGVKSAPLRASAAPFAKIVTELRYGDTVEVVEESGAWVRVRFKTATGWMHRTVLAARVAALKAGQGDVQSTASKDELTLAGKGFNAQVESEYRQQNQQLDFAAIDRMETSRSQPEQMARFLKEGGLTPAGGADE